MNQQHPLTLWRDKAGQSQQDFAADVGVTRWTINSVETGRRKPSIELVKAIEAKTGISRRELRPDLYEAA